MRQTSIKSDEVADLLDEIVERTGETKVDAVKHALARRLAELSTRDQAERTLEWLRTSVWSDLPPGLRRRAPSKEEQEELLGHRALRDGAEGGVRTRLAEEDDGSRLRPSNDLEVVKLG